MQPGALADGRAEQSSPCRHRPPSGQNSAAIRAVVANSSRTLRRRENAALDFGAIQASDGTPNGPGTTRARSAEFQPRRRGPRTDPPASGARLPLETATAPRRHADRLVRSCALTCDIRIGPSENSPALAFSVRPRR